MSVSSFQIVRTVPQRLPVRGARYGPVWAAVIVALLLGTGGPARAARESDRQLVQLVVDAIERNYSFIDTAELAYMKSTSIAVSARRRLRCIPQPMVDNYALRDPQERYETCASDSEAATCGSGARTDRQ